MQFTRDQFITVSQLIDEMLENIEDEIKDCQDKYDTDKTKYLHKMIAYNHASSIIKWHWTVFIEESVIK